MVLLIAAVLISLHFYFFCYAVFAEKHFTFAITDRLAANFCRLGPLHYKAGSKLLILFFIALSRIGTNVTIRSRTRRQLVRQLFTGVALYFGSDGLLQLAAGPTTIAMLYAIVMLSGLFLIYNVLGDLASRLYTRLSTDIFNTYNESFPQQETPVSNLHSLHFPARYSFRNQTRNSMISLPNIFAGTIVIGKPGSGKTRYFFRPMIRQSLEKAMALFVFDLKYPDLTRLTWQHLQQVQDRYKVRPAFYSVNFDDLSTSHRFNVLDPACLDELSDVIGCARTILFGLNRSWTAQQGEFFADSAVAFLIPTIWFLRRYANGRYCTLPHLIELIHTDYDGLFSVLQSDPETRTQIQPFVTAYLENTRDQIQGQIDSLRIPLAGLISPKIYYLLSGSDFTPDINNPKSPKIICVGSNPQKQHVYGPVISLLFNRMLKAVNKKGGISCHLVVDEVPAFRALGLDVALAQARENKVAITLGAQDLSQLRQEYGRDASDALFNLPGNIICGQVSGDTVRLVSERFGNILQEKTTTSTGSRYDSTSETNHLDPAVPAGTLSTLSSGEFVGIVADTPDQPICLKRFHCRLLAPPAETDGRLEPIPKVRDISRKLIDSHFLRIKEEIAVLVRNRLEEMRGDRTLAMYVVTKKRTLAQQKQSLRHP